MNIKNINHLNRLGDKKKQTINTNTSANLEQPFLNF